MHFGFEHHPERIHQKMALPSAEFLWTVITAHAADAGGLYRLSVEDTSAWLGMATSTYAHTGA